MSSVINRFSVLTSVARKQKPFTSSCSSAVNHSVLFTKTGIKYDPSFSSILYSKFYSSLSIYTPLSTIHYKIEPQKMTKIVNLQMSTTTKVKKEDPSNTDEIKTFSDVVRLFKKESLEDGINMETRSDSDLIQDAVFGHFEDFKAKGLGLFIKGFGYKMNGLNFFGHAEYEFKRAAELDPRLKDIISEQMAEMNSKVKISTL